MQDGADLFLVELPAELSTRHERRHSVMVAALMVMVLRKTQESNSSALPPIAEQTTLAAGVSQGPAA